MSFNFLDQGFPPSDSYSRQLDRRVAAQEYPYGYDGDPPPAGHENEPGDEFRYRNQPLMIQKRIFRERR